MNILKMRYFALLLVVMALSILQFGCKKEKTDKPKLDTYKLAPNTRIINNPTAQIIKTVDSVNVVFNGNTAQLDSLKVGDIIISGIAPNAPYGFLRKITNIQKTGSTYTYATVEVPLQEAFEELHVNFTKTFTVTDSAKRLSSADFQLDFPNIILYDGDGNQNTKADQIKLSENLTLTPTINIIIDISAFQPSYFKAEATFQSKLDQAITAGGSVGTISKKIKLYELPLTPIPLAGGFLIIRPNLRLNVGAEASLNVSVSASQKINSKIIASIEYKNKSWSKDYTQTMESTSNFSGLNGSASAKVFLEPAIDFKLYDSDNLKGSISAQGYLKAKGVLLPTPDCELKAGISAGASANFYEIASISYPEIFDFSKVIYTCSGNAVVPTSNFTSDYTTITAGASINFNDLSTGNPSTWSWSFPGGTPNTSTEQNPTVQYNTAGTYNVVLTVTNAKGNNTNTKTGYIVVANNTQLPNLTITNISNVTNTTASSGGTISSQGGSAVTARGVCWSTNPNPTIANTKTTNGTSIGSFVSNITGLTTNTTYYVRAYATNSSGTAYSTQLSFITTGSGNTNNPNLNPNLTYGSVTDVEGNKYATIQIGYQTWMAENLKTSKYNDGTAIPNVTDNTAWSNLTSGAYSVYNFSPENNATYGKLYNWYAVNTGKLAPAGWHVATDAEWEQLNTYLGSNAGLKMKSIGNITDGTGLWNKSAGSEGTNTSGFSGLPGGYRSYDGTFYVIGGFGFWWSSSEYNTNYAWSRGLNYSDSDLYRYDYSKKDGFSVRCVRD